MWFGAGVTGFRDVVMSLGLPNPEGVMEVIDGGRRDGWTHQQIGMMLELWKALKDLEHEFKTWEELKA